MTLCTAVPKGSSNRMQVPLSRPSITQADIAAVLEVLNSPSLSLGPKLAAFERAMAEFRNGRGGGCQQRYERPASLSCCGRYQARRRGDHDTVQLCCVGELYSLSGGDAGLRRH